MPTDTNFLKLGFKTTVKGVIMKYRKKMSRKGSRKYFTKNAKKVHAKNSKGATVMRGGYRL